MNWFTTFTIIYLSIIFHTVVHEIGHYLFLPSDLKTGKFFTISVGLIKKPFYIQFSIGNLCIKISALFFDNGIFDYKLTTRQSLRYQPRYKMICMDVAGPAFGACAGMLMMFGGYLLFGATLSKPIIDRIFQSGTFVEFVALALWAGGIIGVGSLFNLLPFKPMDGWFIYKRLTIKNKNQKARRDY